MNINNGYHIPSYLHKYIDYNVVRADLCQICALFIKNKEHFY